MCRVKKSYYEQENEYIAPQGCVQFERFNLLNTWIKRSKSTTNQRLWHKCSFLRNEHTVNMRIDQWKSMFPEGRAEAGMYMSAYQKLFCVIKLKAHRYTELVHVMYTCASTTTKLSFIPLTFSTIVLLSLYSSCFNIRILFGFPIADRSLNTGNNSTLVMRYFGAPWWHLQRA